MMIFDEETGRSLAMHGLPVYSTNTTWKRVTGEEGSCPESPREASGEREEFHERKKSNNHQPSMTNAGRQWQKGEGGIAFSVAEWRQWQNSAAEAHGVGSMGMICTTSGLNRGLFRPHGLVEIY